MPSRQSMFDILAERTGFEPQPQNRSSSFITGVYDPSFIPLPPLPGDPYQDPRYPKGDLGPGSYVPLPTVNPRESRYQTERQRTEQGGRAVARRDEQWHDIMQIPEGFVGNVGDVPTKRGQRFGPFGAL